MPEEAEPEDWHDLIWQAWEDLRYDRPYLAMGGELPVSFTAIETYARRYGLVGMEFEEFKVLFRAVDDEWLTYRAEKDKEESARREAAARHR